MLHWHAQPPLAASSPYDIAVFLQYGDVLMARAQCTMAGTCEWSSYDFSRNSWTRVALYLWHKQQCPRLGKHHVIKPHQIHRVTAASAGKPQFGLHFPSDVESSFSKVTILTELPGDCKAINAFLQVEQSLYALKTHRLCLQITYF